MHGFHFVKHPYWKFKHYSWTFEEAKADFVFYVTRVDLSLAKLNKEKILSLIKAWEDNIKRKSQNRYSLFVFWLNDVSFLFSKSSLFPLWMMQSSPFIRSKHTFQLSWMMNSSHFKESWNTNTHTPMAS